MNKKILIALGGLALIGTFFAKKMTNFVNKLSFSIKKAKVKLPFPYNNLSITLTCELDNPTSQEIKLNSIFGTLKYQGKDIASFYGNPMQVKSGKNKFDIEVGMTIQQLQNIMNTTFDLTSFATIYKQIIRTPLTTDITYNTELGTFRSVDDWKLQELI